MELKQAIASSEEALRPSRIAHGEERDFEDSKGGKNGARGLGTKAKGKRKDSTGTEG